MNANNNAKPFLSIIVPMCNEEGNIKSTLDRIDQAVKDTYSPYEVVVVDDGSTDRTLQVLQDSFGNDPRVRIFSHGENFGRGRALRTGFAEAKGEFIVSIDADLSYDPIVIGRLIDALTAKEHMHIAVASPYMVGGGTENVPFFRLLVSRLGNKILSFFFPQKISTSTGIFRAYRASAIRSLELESNGKEIHLEILSKAFAVGFGVIEIPAILRGRKVGRSKFRFKKTAMSHIVFSIFEKPYMILEILGLSLFLFGGLALLLLQITKMRGIFTPGLPLSMMLIAMVTTGAQIILFGILAVAIGRNRRELIKIQKMIKEKFDT
jgi:glycosyltransferase involved in cell wall biosynthesis